MKFINFEISREYIFPLDNKAHVCLRKLFTILLSGVNNKPASGFSFAFGKNNEIRKEYLGTGY